MKPWRTWLARLGVFGALAIVSGCGSGDVPDPNADGPVAALPEGSAPAQPAPPAAPAVQNVAAEDKAEDAKAEETTAQAQPAASAPAPAQEAPATGGGAGSAPPDRNSATAEMLAMATKEQPAPPPSGDSAPGGAPAPGGGAPEAAGPAPGGPPGRGPGGGQQAQMQGQQQQQRMQMQGQQQQQQQQQMMQQMQGRMQQGGPGAGGMAGSGGPGTGGNNNQPPDFRTPAGAVLAFMDALKARDLNRLTDATALRAGTNEETAPRNREMFRRIIEGTLSESELTALAARLENYTMSSYNPPKSSNRYDVILAKRTSSNNYQTATSVSNMAMQSSTWTIKVTVRLEKKGWGVCDISAPAEFKNPTMVPSRGSGRRR
jgi:hypothetical protein